MENRHWNDEEFVERLYGVGPADDHLEACELCRRRWNLYQERRQNLRITTSEIPVEMLVAQRRSVFARIEERPMPTRLRLLPSFGVVLLVLVVVMVFRPVPKPQSVESIPDSELYQEVFTMVSSASPSAVEPLQSLFEVQQ